MSKKKIYLLIIFLCVPYLFSACAQVLTGTAAKVITVAKEDRTIGEFIDDALINIDYQLEALNSGAVTPQEVIDDVENINKAFGNELLKVPSPEEVQKIKNAEELML